jgi:D-3-phosphoglycerate dehydrogenase / 2-oxoglutarate reductase
VLKGVFRGVTDEPVSYVNAPRIAVDRGVEVRDTSTATAHDYVNLISIRGGDHGIGGTLVGLRGEPRIVMLDGHTIDLPPAKHMLVVRNDDRPGMIAFVAGALSDAGVNIDDMHLGRSERGEAALQVIATDQSVPPAVQDTIRAGDGIVSVHAIG